MKFLMTKLGHVLFAIEDKAPLKELYSSKLDIQSNYSEESSDVTITKQGFKEEGVSMLTDSLHYFID